ncbi:MAG: response regulator [Chloroflexales bacterium]|nr:response regulator [Chloroflexales bacterium]
MKSAADTAPPPTLATRPRADDLARETRQLRVLLADDNETNSLVIEDYLQSHGYAVVIARNGIEALEQIQIEPPDIVLMDIQMPGMDGLEATRRVRADPGLRALPIIALTALAMPGDRERCLEAGADAYFTKPISLRTLLDALEQHLHKTDSTKQAG